MLNQISMTCSAFVNILKKFVHHIKLVITREDLLNLFSASSFILFPYYLSIVFDNVCEPLGAQDGEPQIISLDSAWIWRVACAVIISFVKGQKPRVSVL